MEYYKLITLKDGRECCLRNGTESDGAAVYDNFNLTHSETDFLLAYPDENSFDAAQESRFLNARAESENEALIVAVINGAIVGTAGLDAVGGKYKVSHRAEFGIGIAKEYWGLGIGKALTNACIDCARAAGYTQLELSAVAGNEGALAMYRKAGFVEYGRNPRGFRSRMTRDYQELVYMRLELR